LMLDLGMMSRLWRNLDVALLELTVKVSVFLLETYAMFISL
jgi:hypothetical protein